MREARAGPPWVRPGLPVQAAEAARAVATATGAMVAVGATAGVGATGALAVTWYGTAPSRTRPMVRASAPARRGEAVCCSISSLLLRMRNVGEAPASAGDGAVETPSFTSRRP